MTIIINVIIVFLLLRLLVSFYNVVSKPLLKQSNHEHSDFISILIPARNEEVNIINLLTDLEKINYSNYEIIVLNDHSTDNTEKVTKEFINKNKRINLINGKDLPVLWLGKNWACHQLANVAKGDYLLFIDADISLHPDTINSALTEIKKKNLALLTLFPDQIMLSFGEKLVVPLMHYILLSLLPLRFVYYFKKKSLSAANGQFMLFNKINYLNWHEKVKDKVTEDIEIMKLIKKNGIKGEVLLGNKLVKCRMYKNLKEGINGFSKNLFAGFNNNLFIFSVFLILIYFGFILFCIYVNWIKIIIAIISILLIRVFISIISKQNILFNTVFHPVQMFILIIIAYKSMIMGKKGKIEWKGRIISGK
ncbi:MAG: glycosyltransferase family 2 protein [Bacteroidales bacterium]|nr:glycosyltransferase family 2 protein [Bacteroidales bacterium]